MSSRPTLEKEKPANHRKWILLFCSQFLPEICIPPDSRRCPFSLALTAFCGNFNYANPLTLMKTLKTVHINEVTVNSERLNREPEAPIFCQTAAKLCLNDFWFGGLFSSVRRLYSNFINENSIYTELYRIIKANYN